MSNIVVVGNVIKDIYLGLDEHQNKFEKDENGTPWLDLAFNGEKNAYFRRTSVFNGAAISKKVLSDFGLTATIATNAGDFPVAYQYILSLENKVSRFVPTYKVETTWKAPVKISGWIFVDASAELSNELIDGVKSYLAVSGRTRLVVAVSSMEENGEPKTWSSAERELVSMANLAFIDGALPEDVHREGLTCEIGKNFIKLGKTRRYFAVKNEILATDRKAIVEIISATIFGSLLRGKTGREALDYAKANVENATLNDTWGLAKLENKTRDYEGRRRDLRLIADTLMTPKKGILAADESSSSIHRKFEAAGIEDSEEHRRSYRNLFLSMDGVEKYLSGVILYDETTRQKTDDGQNFVAHLIKIGVIGGIKVDQGLEPFSKNLIESGKVLATDTYTKGLDGLLERVKDYYRLGLRFAKWRSAFLINASDYAIRKNARDMAKYAYICQEVGMVPIVEPELIYDGDYNIDDSAIVTGKILDHVFEALREENVDLSACILKTNMVIGGKQRELSSPEDVGKRTAEVLKEHVPEELAGVVFLSGGQGVEQATENLREIMKNGPYPWPLTFSFARAFQDPAIERWRGMEENVGIARDAFRERLIRNVEALLSK